MELGPRDDTVSLSTYNVITERAVLQEPILSWHVKRVYDGMHGRSKYLGRRGNFCSFGVGNAIRRVACYLNVKSYFLIYIYKSCFFVCVIILMFLSRNFVLLTEESRCQVLFVVFFVIVI